MPLGFGVPSHSSNDGRAVDSTDIKLSLLGEDAAQSTCNANTIFGKVNGMG